jgi:DNA-directed RNA polymerase subunit RPC12/RpoP
MNPEGTDSFAMVSYLVFALVVTVSIVGFCSQRRLAKEKTSIEPMDYWEEKQWDEYPEGAIDDTRTPEEIKEYYDTKEWGRSNPAYTCPHCHAKGFVRTKAARKMKDINVAKQIGLVLMGGWALLGAGLTKEEEYTQVHCGKCGSTWEV